MEVCVLDLFSTLDVDVGSCRDHVSLVCTADGVWCGDRWLESDVVLCASGDNDIPHKICLCVGIERERGDTYTRAQRRDRVFI